MIDIDRRTFREWAASVETKRTWFLVCVMAQTAIWTRLAMTAPWYAWTMQLPVVWWAASGLVRSFGTAP